ncbi:MAG: hypothetical protein ACFFEJ_05860 [Candidatus Thorarchaeota archaeon]
MNHLRNIRKIWLPDGSCQSGDLAYDDGRIVVSLDGLDGIFSQEENLILEMDTIIVIGDNGISRETSLRRPIRVKLAPKFLGKKTYSKEAKEDEFDIYPESSYRFYGKLVRGKQIAIFLVQEILDDNRLWLTIFDPQTYEIHQSHPIHLYEFDVIRLKTFYELYSEYTSAFKPKNPQKAKSEICNLIDISQISWSEITNMTQGIIPSTFLMTHNAKGLFGQLFPIQIFQDEVRDQLLAFLTWVAKDLLPKDDIVEFIERTMAVPLFRDLYIAHLRFVLNDITPPNYIDIINDSIERFTTSSKSVEERVRWNPDFILRDRIESLSPNNQDEITSIIRSLNRSNTIHTTLPIQKEKGMDYEATRKRLIMYDMYIRLRTHVRTRALGLRELIYIGSAYRWPTLHTASSIRLGASDSPAPYMQSMIMPVSAAEQVKRVLPKVLDIEWASHSINMQLYNQSESKWTINPNRISESFSRKKSLKDLMDEFGVWKGDTTYFPDEKEVRILDMTSNMFYLSDLESETGREYWQTDENESKAILSKLRNNGIIDISYWYDFKQSLSPVYVSLRGPENIVCSITYSLLKDVPTSLVRITDRGKVALIASRVPPEYKSVFFDTIQENSKNTDLVMQCSEVSGHRNYTTDLYQRLRCSDDTWNSDITGLLSQIRSLPKTLLDEITAEISQSR